MRSSSLELVRVDRRFQLFCLSHTQILTCPYCEVGIIGGSFHLVSLHTPISGHLGRATEMQLRVLSGPGDVSHVGHAQNCVGVSTNDFSQSHYADLTPCLIYRVT